LDGSTPTAASTTYSAPIPIPANTVGFTLKAFARKAGQADSPVATATYNTVNTPTWITNGDGLWSNLPGDELNWQNTVVAGGIGGVADFSKLALTQNTVVTLDGSRPIGSMAFGDASVPPAFDWSLVSQNSSGLVLATSNGTPQITVLNQMTTFGVSLSGNQGLAKGGPGSLNLTAASSYTGATVVNAGSLILNSSTIASQAPQLASETIQNAAAVTFYRNALGFTPINASLSGTGDFIVDGPGGGALYDNRFAFRGVASDNTGTVRILNEGRLWIDLAGKNAIGDSAIVEVGSAASFYIYQGISETIGGLAGSGNVYGGDAAGISALTVGGGDKSAEFSGVLQNQFSTLTLTKIGTGTQVLSGVNTYTGNTVINAGKLELAATGRLTFRITNTTTNTLTGTGTATFNGGFTIDTSAVTTGAGPWQIENVTSLSGPYGSTFQVVNPDGSPWTDAGNDKWTQPATEGKIWTFSEATGVLTLNTGGFTSWADANAPGETISQDHDGDGVPNGVEYFMGLSGSAFTANPVPDATRKVAWPKGASYLGSYATDYTVQTSTDLTDWTDVPVGDVTDGGILEYTIPSGSSARFVRLKVTGP
jgi:autotransporter-associated beta strand protein